MNGTKVSGMGGRKFRMLGEGHFHLRGYRDVSLVGKNSSGTQLRTQENLHV